MTGIGSNDSLKARNLLNFLSGSLSSVNNLYFLTSPTATTFSDYRNDPFVTNTVPPGTLLGPMLPAVEEEVGAARLRTLRVGRLTLQQLDERLNQAEARRRRRAPREGVARRHQRRRRAEIPRLSMNG